MNACARCARTSRIGGHERLASNRVHTHGRRSCTRLVATIAERMDNSSSDGVARNAQGSLLLLANLSSLSARGAASIVKQSRTPTRHEKKKYECLVWVDRRYSRPGVWNGGLGGVLGGYRCSASQGTTASVVFDSLVLRGTSATRRACRRPAAPASALQVTQRRAGCGEESLKPCLLCVFLRVRQTLLHTLCVCSF